MSCAVVTGTQLGDALEQVEAAHRAANRPALTDAVERYIGLLVTSRRHVLVGHLAGLTVGVLLGRWLP